MKRGEIDKMEIIKKRRKFNNLSVVFLIVLQLIIILYSMNQKIDFHVDEYYTYGLANNAENLVGFWTPDNVEYRGEEAFKSYLTVDQNHRFDYSLVWNNQTNDTHPPLYYAVIHTICSCFPGVFTRWFGMAANLIFFVISALLIYKISEKLFDNSIKALLTLAVWGCVTGTVNTAIFIRMYMMVTVFVLAIILIHLEIYTFNKLTWKFYVKLLLLTVGGALTHYYFLVFILFAAFFYGIYMLAYKRFRETILYVITYVSAGIISLGIFPAMIAHIFNGERGKQAFDAFQHGSNYITQAIEYLKLVTDETIGNIWIFSVLCILSFIILLNYILTDGIKKTIYKVVNSPFFAFFLITLCYFCIIIKIAPYITNRYISPVYGLIIILMMEILYSFVHLLSIKSVVKKVAILFFAVLVLGGTWNYGLQNLLLYKQTAINTAAANSDKNVLYVYDGAGWKTICNRKELINFQSYVFVKTENLQQYLSGKDLNGSFLYVTSVLDQESIIEQIKAANVNVNSVEYLYNSEYASVYKLSMQ